MHIIYYDNILNQKATKEIYDINQGRSNDQWRLTDEVIDRNTDGL
jgi:hypothetical protein